ncbi:MAG: MAPEG family protein [Pseudomonadota bacterium]
MTPLESAAFWIGINAILLTYLSVRVGQARMKHSVLIGDGGNEAVLNAIRTQGNYIEYAPAVLVGLVALALIGASSFVINVVGGVFSLARICHLLGLGMGVWPTGRTVGAVLTMLSLIAVGGALIYYALT